MKYLRHGSVIPTNLDLNNLACGKCKQPLVFTATGQLTDILLWSRCWGCEREYIFTPTDHTVVRE